MASGNEVVSTALRFRNRQQTNPVVVLDALAGAQADTVRVLIDSLSVTDNTVALYRRLSPGDRLVLFTDLTGQYNTNVRTLSDSLNANDNTVRTKQTRKITFDQTIPTDAGFITDKDLLRFRLLENNFQLTDSFQKTITLADFFIIDKTIIENIIVIDNIAIEVSGVVIRTLFDSIAIEDFEWVDYLIHKADDLTVTDNAIKQSFINRILVDDLIVTDDIIVTRDAIVNTVQVSDSITMFDQALFSTGSFVSVSAKIKHGIENF